MHEAFEPRSRAVTVRGVPLVVRSPTAREALEIRAADTTEERLFRAIAACVRDESGAAVFDSADAVGRADAGVIDELAAVVVEVIGGGDGSDFPRDSSSRD